MGISHTRGSLHSTVSVLLFYRDVFFGNRGSLVSHGDTGRRNTWDRGTMISDFRHGRGSGFNAGWLAADGWREKVLQPGGQGSTRHLVIGHMILTA